MIRTLRPFLVAGALLLLAGCGSLLPEPGAPPKLYTLTPVRDFPPAQRQVPWQLLVDTAASPAALDTPRIALSRSTTSIDYFADVAWTDRAPLMVQSVLIESLENSGRILAVGRETLALRADYVLKPELRHFEAEYRGSDPPRPHVQLSVKLVKMPERTIVAQRSFDSAVPAQRNDVPAIVDAFNAALQSTTRQAVDWVLDGAGGAVR
jgi:cholesterol transport system auxiliary component